MQRFRYAALARSGVWICTARCMFSSFVWLASREVRGRPVPLHHADVRCKEDRDGRYRHCNHEGGTETSEERCFRDHRFPCESSGESCVEESPRGGGTEALKSPPPTGKRFLVHFFVIVKVVIVIVDDLVVIWRMFVLIDDLRGVLRILRPVPGRRRE